MKWSVDSQYDVPMAIKRESVVGHFKYPGKKFCVHKLFGIHKVLTYSSTKDSSGLLSEGQCISDRIPEFLSSTKIEW